MRAIFSNGCAKGCFILIGLFVLVVMVTTMGLGGLRAKFGIAEVQGNKPGMPAQAATTPQSSASLPPDGSIVPDGSGGGSGGAPTPTTISAPPPPITQPEPQVQPQPQATSAVSQPVEGQGGTITGEATSPFYIVQPGDSVWQISHKFGIDMDEFRIKNNIENNLIYPGQVVYLPDPSQPASSVPAAVVGAPTPDSGPGSPSTGVGPDSISGGDTPDVVGDQGEDAQVPAMPNTGITSRRP